jgi:hypothetical protein
MTGVEVVIGCTASFKASEQKRMPAGPLQVGITFARAPGLERKTIVLLTLLLQVSDCSLSNHTQSFNIDFLNF